MLGARVVERVAHVTYRLLQDGYAEPHEYHEQHLMREIWILGLCVSRRTLDSEHVPLHAVISVGCFGDTGGFVSKFAPFDKNGIKSQ